MLNLFVFLTPCPWICSGGYSNRLKLCKTDSLATRYITHALSPPPTPHWRLYRLLTVCVEIIFVCLCVSLAWPWLYFASENQRPFFQYDTKSQSQIRISGFPVSELTESDHPYVAIFNKAKTSLCDWQPTKQRRVISRIPHLFYEISSIAFLQKIKRLCTTPIWCW